MADGRPEPAMINAEAIPFVLVAAIGREHVPREEHWVEPPLTSPTIRPVEDVEVQSGRRYAAHGALTERVERLRERLSLIPSARDEQQIGVEGCVAYLLPGGPVLLKLDNLMAKCAEGFGYIL